MKKRLATIYAIFCTLLLVAGFLLVFYFAWEKGTTQIAECLAGLIASLIFAPIIHELGHVCMGFIAKMDYVYVKCFCFKFYVKNGKKRFAFASPFTADQTQMLPKTGGNMQKRATLYTLGGLVFSGIFLTLLLAGAITTACVGVPDYTLFGLLPYTAYLFLLNLPAIEYASGKTDTAVYRGIRKGEDVEKCMLSAMEIQGQLFEGKSFLEIDEGYYFGLPQLCEDEPLYAVLLDLRYRYYLEKGEMEKAADCLNRLALNEAYLPLEEVEKVAAELVYMHALTGNIEDAEKNYEACKSFLKEENATAKRILCAYASACQNTEAAEILLQQASLLLEKENIAGVKKFEDILLSRLANKKDESREN